MPKYIVANHNRSVLYLLFEPAGVDLAQLGTLVDEIFRNALGSTWGDEATILGYLINVIETVIMVHGKSFSFNDLNIYNLHVDPYSAGCFI